MGMLQIHAEALSTKISCYHEFLSRYSKITKVIYGFVEGKDDPCFYQGFIEHNIHEDWEVELWAAGNKHNVLRIHRDIDWRRFPKKRICFFVDHDLMSLIPEKAPKDSNIFVTDKYSIENSITTRGTCKRVLREIFEMSKYSHEEIDTLCGLFEQQFELFLKAMIPVMAWILIWRRKSEKANLSNIKMSKLFSFNNGNLVFDSSKEGYEKIVRYIHKSAGVCIDTSADISQAKSTFKKSANYRKFTRGKYVLWFLIEFCISVHKNAVNLIASCVTIPKVHISISQSNAIKIIGNLPRIPSNLKIFLSKNYISYINLKSAE